MHDVEAVACAARVMADLVTVTRGYGDDCIDLTHLARIVTAALASAGRPLTQPWQDLYRAIAATLERASDVAQRDRNGALLRLAQFLEENADLEPLPVPCHA